MKKGFSKFSVMAVIVLGALFVAAQNPQVPNSGKKPAEQVQVSIDNFTFGPADLAVAAGTTVTWTNKDDIPHTVVSTQKVFASPVLDTDQKFSYTFTQAGTFPYYCSIHPKMTGKVVVR